MTTITTVGYGDVKAETAIERVFVMFVMVVGVSFFTLLSGALASIMTAHDNQSSELKEKVLFLNQIKVKTKMSDALYHQIRQAINFDSYQNHE
jgi:hyperpolarization activated cyclic nucleotide-gated potassium channel 2